MAHIGEPHGREAVGADQLTGLANQRSFSDAVADVASSGRPWTVLIVDLDRLGPVNAVYGRAVGDGVLRTIGERLVGCVGDDEFVARTGGDQFAVLVRSEGDADLCGLALGIIGTVERPMTIGGYTVDVGCSLGIGCAAAGDDPESVLAATDRDLAARKAHRRETLVTTAH